ncbi:MAG: UDP-N-acetylglucosamine diphosphorylase [Verrucomicrobia bacterium RIFCSPHIGHO2_12_FULL_41_10]|nr:MAG: UDP-N-acetylglucosamine diphosphorylase [Verrucomicrobia bacterium RIFCSPHIGHO2_12_FULL_41_10]HLB33832.1 UDP-N-acetylglucosamine diphosphorylase [Chthoniobacterales bacterium]
MFKPDLYLDFYHTEHRILFENITHVWEVLPKIAEYLQLRLKPANHGTFLGKPFIGDHVYIGKGTIIEEGAMIKGPAWIGEGCQLRRGCYIRENVIIGNGVVIGNACEVKNSLIFDEAQIPHFNYVGDSILGFRAHLGAGVILSNVRLDHGPISITTPHKTFATGLKKFGAIIGDRAEIGCNAVLSPGSLIGRDSIVYPTLSWHGVLPEKSIAKSKEKPHVVHRR